MLFRWLANCHPRAATCSLHAEVLLRRPSHAGNAPRTRIGQGKDKPLVMQTNANVQRRAFMRLTGLRSPRGGPAAFVTNSWLLLHPSR